MYASELRACGLGAVVCVFLARVSALAGTTWTTAVEGPRLPRQQLLSLSRMRPILQRRTLLLRRKPQLSMAPCFPVYLAACYQPKAARNVPKAAPAGSINLSA